MTDDAYERLAQRNAELMEELADLMEENKRLRVRLEDTDHLLSGCIESYEGCWTQRANAAALDGAPYANSLARRDAEMRAEGAETVERGLVRILNTVADIDKPRALVEAAINMARNQADEYRRQAEADTAGEGE